MLETNARAPFDFTFPACYALRHSTRLSSTLLCQILHCGVLSNESLGGLVEGATQRSPHPSECCAPAHSAGLCCSNHEPSPLASYGVPPKELFGDSLASRKVNGGFSSVVILFKDSHNERTRGSSCSTTSSAAPSPSGSFSRRRSTCQSRCHFPFSWWCLINTSVCDFFRDESPKSSTRYFEKEEQATYARSPRIRRASWMSFGMMVTRLAWMAAKLVSSKSPTR